MGTIIKKDRSNKKGRVVGVRSKRKNVPCVLLYICSTFSNTIATVTDYSGTVLVSMGTGCCGYKNTKKATLIAAQDVVKQVLLSAIEMYGVVEIELILKGIGPHREAAVLGIEPLLKTHKIVVKALFDKTSGVFNGCRAEKRRKV